ncbi:MAG: VWA domain-containing protein [Myxococcales bacterium]|nr:VWA domain-containing protein [Myxococcales bacterium]MBL0195055.1 VWA domain-containing protein [Myxococcales bacterium]HQY61806.1 VWA domain-containing protein [Polyangiaceae bacterium]
MISRHTAFLAVTFGMLAVACDKQEPAAKATAPEPTSIEGTLADKKAADQPAPVTAATAGARPAAELAGAVKEEKAKKGAFDGLGAAGGAPAPGAGIGGGAGQAGWTGDPMAGKPSAPRPLPKSLAKPVTAAPRGAPVVIPAAPQANAYAAPREEPAVAAPVVPKLDPNARYATTYRPGGAALSAFDAAVAKGDIPGEYKDLVGDFGSRYAPQMDAPKDAALSFKVETEREKLAPAGGPLNLRISLRSSATTAARAPLSVHLVLDVSGSMSGLAIDNARKAAASLVERLDARDDFSMVTFSNSAEVLVPDGPVGPRKAKILGAIGEVRANGGTNISSGLDLGYAQAHSAGISPEAVRIVMLLSDGHANGGDTNPARLAERSARAFQDGIQTSSFGLGADFDAPLMSSIADRGAGGYYYLADSAQIAGALAKEMDSRLVPSALGVEVRVRLRPDVTPTRVFGSRELQEREAQQVRAQEVAVDKIAAAKGGIARDRQEDAVGGMRFFMPAFSRDDHHAILLGVTVPPGTGERALASVEVRYKDRLRKKNVTDELPVKIAFAGSDAESAATANASVVATVQAFAAGDAIVEAERMVDTGQRLAATRLLQERAELLKRAAVTLSEPRLGEDAIRLARLSRAVGGEGQVKDPLPLAMLLRGSAYGYLR